MSEIRSEIRIQWSGDACLLLEDEFTNRSPYPKILYRVISYSGNIALETSRENKFEELPYHIAVVK